MVQTKLTLILRILSMVILLALVVEVRGVWTELKHIRNEQVKNKLNTLPAEVMDRINNKPNKEILLRQFESTVNVAGSVDVNGTVNVEIENQPVDVRISH